MVEWVLGLMVAWFFIGIARYLSRGWTERPAKRNRVKITTNDFAVMRQMGLDPTDPAIVRRFAVEKYHAAQDLSLSDPHAAAASALSPYIVDPAALIAPDPKPDARQRAIDAAAAAYGRKLDAEIQKMFNDVLLFGQGGLATSLDAAQFDAAVRALLQNQGGYHYGNNRKAGAQVYGSAYALSGTVGGGAGAGGAIPAGAVSGIASAIPPGTIFASPDDPSPPTVKDTGIEVGEVTAYRAWRLLGRDYMLESIVADEVWFPGKVMEGDPEISTRGVHAFKTTERAMREYNVSARRPPIDCPMVFGSIKLWGTIYQHEEGYRAQYGIPYEIHGVWAKGAELEYDAYHDKIVWRHTGLALDLFERLKNQYDHAGMLPEPRPPRRPEPPDMPDL